MLSVFSISRLGYFRIMLLSLSTSRLDYIRIKNFCDQKVLETFLQILDRYAKVYEGNHSLLVTSRKVKFAFFFMKAKILSIRREALNFVLIIPIRTQKIINSTFAKVNNREKFFFGLFAKFMFAKCKKFTIFRIRETFCLLKFLILKYFGLDLTVLL